MTAGKQLGREISNAFCKNAQKRDRKHHISYKNTLELTFSQRRLEIKATFVGQGCYNVFIGAESSSCRSYVRKQREERKDLTNGNGGTRLKRKETNQK